MDHNGQRGPSTPSAMLASLLSRRAKHQEEHRNIERQVYDMETSYLQDPGQCGNVLKGFEGFLSSSNKTLPSRSDPRSSNLKIGYSIIFSLLLQLKRLLLLEMGSL
ncbi:chromatin modification-related protein MEAF6-like [Hibiscus syriacus]|uniref:chromatin modification-related protein MEAF6-like n=1 Tax=Hibiscus syriacus TaxID=106335 RepID=UPI001924D36D|nr:chromatin modification-related protein MEAF6-like [Hibiscus syriacus]